MPRPFAHDGNIQYRRRVSISFFLDLPVFSGFSNR